jgi:hypothetical protein
MMRSGAGVGGVTAGAGGLIRLSSLSLPLLMMCRSLHDNQLTGTIPSQLAGLTGLTYL